MTHPPQINPKLDLVLERTVSVPPTLVWKAWTQPELLKQWFAPAPWTTTACEIDLRPGGIFRAVMRSPEGQDFPSEGCCLEVVENKKLMWTDSLVAGYRPSTQPFFTGVVLLEPHGQGTKYTAIAMHKDEDTRKKHEEMGFYTGWSQCLDQLVAVVQNMHF